MSGDILTNIMGSGSATLEEAWEAGRKLTIEQAIDEALAVVAQTPANGLRDGAA